jgi:hypothetical protein
MIRKITVVGLARDPTKLFARGTGKNEFYFISPPKRASEELFFHNIYASVKSGKKIKVEAEVDGRTANLIYPSKLENSISKIKTSQETIEQENIFKAHNVALNYNSRKCIIIDPWNGAGDLFDIQYIVREHSFDLVNHRQIDPTLRELVKSWKCALDVNSRDVFYEYCAKVNETIKSRDKDVILNQVISEKIKMVRETAKSQNVDLVLMGMFTWDNSSHFGGGIGDICDLNENGLTVVNELRENGYKGSIVALKAHPYTLPDTDFNRRALHSIFKKDVIISPSTKKETLIQILKGGYFISDYTLDGTPAEISQYRLNKGLTCFDPVRPI